MASFLELEEAGVAGDSGSIVLSCALAKAGALSREEKNATFLECPIEHRVLGILAEKPMLLDNFPEIHQTTKS